jgi:glycine cleavage system H protein
MVVLLVVLTFAVLIAADFYFNRERYRVPAEIVEAPAPVAAIQGIRIPAELMFHPGHTWMAREGPDYARVGVDEFAMRLLGTPQKLALPSLARWLRQGERAFAVGQDGRAAEFVSPVEGEVVEINRAVVDNPALLKTDPYNAWLMRVRAPDLPVSSRNLLKGSLAVRWMEDSLDRLRQMFAPTAMATAQEGGPLLEGLARGLNDVAWQALQTEFFRLGGEERSRQ